MIWLWLACAGTPDSPSTSQEEQESEQAQFDVASYLSQCEQALCALEASGCDTELGCGEEDACQGALARDCNFTWSEEPARACLEALDAASSAGTCLSPGDWTKACGEVFSWVGGC